MRRQVTKSKLTPTKTAASAITQLSVPTWLMCAFLVLSTILAYQPVWHAGFIWDDDFYITDNLTLRSFGGLRLIWCSLAATPQYYPLVHTSFWLEYHLWGLNPLGYHIVNVLLQSLAAILLWRVLVRLQLPGACLAAGIFALHPVGVETVAWVTERKNVLAAVFYFASALAYLRWTEQRANDKAQTGDFSCWYFLAFAFFAAALFSKTIACSLPAAMLLVIWWKRGCILAGCLAVAAVFRGRGDAGTGYFVVGADPRRRPRAGMELQFFRALSDCRACGVVLRGQIVWPANLTFIYPRWQIDAGEWRQWIFPAATLGLVAVLWRLRQAYWSGAIGGGAVFWRHTFAGTGFRNVFPMRYSFVADHFQYVASIGLIVLAAAGITMAFGLARKKGICGLKPAFCGVLLLILGVLTWRQCRIYGDAETLWRATIDRDPACWMAYDNLDDVLFHEGRWGGDRQAREFVGNQP